MKIFRLEELRKDSNVYQEDIAKFLKITQPQYSLYERGIRLMPIDLLSKLADFYNTSVDFLICRTDEKKPYKKSTL